MGSDHDKHAFVDQWVTNQTSISGGTVGGVMTGGSGNTMHIQQSFTPLEAAGIRAKVDEILKNIADVEGVEQLLEAVQAVRDEVDSPDASKSAVKDKVVEGISIAGNLSSVAQVGPLVASVLPILAQLLSMM